VMLWGSQRSGTGHGGGLRQAGQGIMDVFSSMFYGGMRAALRQVG
jgi:hypothetical protein